MDTLGVLLAVVGLVFLFWGEPDVWDHMRAKAMDRPVVIECPRPTETPKPEKGLAF